MKDNLKIVGWAALIAAVIVVSITVGNRYRAYQANKAIGALYAARGVESGSEAQQKALKEVAEDYRSTAAGREAMMMLGDLFLNRGDFAAALEQYESLAGASGRSELLKVAAIHRSAKVLRSMGKTEEAAQKYLAAAEDKKNLNKAESYFEAARCFEDLKQYGEAAKFYRMAIDVAQSGDVRSKSEDRILWFVSNGLISG